jgi:hypothetical protein
VGCRLPGPVLQYHRHIQPVSQRDIHNREHVSDCETLLSFSVDDASPFRDGRENV